MFMILREVAAALVEKLGDKTSVRLFIGDRKHETIYAVSIFSPAQTQYSDEILYVVQDDTDLNAVNIIPKNLLLAGSDAQNWDEYPEDKNIVLVRESLAYTEIEEYLHEVASTESYGAYLPRQLIEVLGTSNLQTICSKVSILMGNPVIVLNVNFGIEAFELLDTDNEKLQLACKEGNLDFELFERLTEDRHAQSVPAGEAVLSEIAEKNMRIIHSVVSHDGIPQGFVLLIEDRVQLAQEDKGFIARIANLLHLVIQFKNMDVNSRLIQEYMLVRMLNDSHAEDSYFVSRMNAAGFSFERNKLIICLDSSKVQTDDLQGHLKSLLVKARDIFGPKSLTTIFKDQIISLFNTREDEIPEALVANLNRFLSSTDGIQAGISQIFNDTAEIKTYYRQAIDTIVVGRIIDPANRIFIFNDYRIYKFISNGVNSHDRLFYVHPKIITLIHYDRNNKTNYMEVLYYYLQTLKNTKETANLLHIHRNTLVYRLEKIKTIMELSFDDGTVIFDLMLSFKILEYDAMSAWGDVCFLPKKS